MNLARVRMSPATVLLALLVLAVVLVPAPALSAERSVAVRTTGSVVHARFATVRDPGVPAAPALGPAVAIAKPVRVRIPAIGVDSSLESLGLLADGSLEEPDEWDRAGWFDGGVVPGQVGPAIIAGHVDSTNGPAVFFRLRQLRPGDDIEVTDSTGRVRTFLVDRARAYAKARFPASKVYAGTHDPQLRLITCTGAFDVGKLSYVDNLVVSAHLIGG